MLQPGIELAVEQINQREDLLAGYSVNLTVANSACNLKLHTIINFVTTFFYSGVKFAGIVGPLCSDAVKLISPITRQEGVSLLNFHAGSSLQFTDRNRYRYAFSTVTSTKPFIELFLHLMKVNEWESVAVLYEQQTTVYLNAYDSLVEKLPHVYPEGKILFSAPVSEESLPLSSIIHQHLRVVILITTPNIAHKILCLIQRRYPELTFPSYQFILFGDYLGYYRPVSLTLNNHHYKCSAAEIGRVMDRFLLTGLKLDVANSTELVSGVTYAENFQEYEERANGSATLPANALYDGVWSLALALNNSIPRLNEIGLDMVDYTYGHREATDIIRDEVLKLHFQELLDIYHSVKTPGSLLPLFLLNR
ncbi:Gamma-aminobutyric acid type B receptor subunit 1 [Geodia barretti]|uniref:Gamma-aminobutyric acid type B receptor subunit 1 n=1 Tax=Geodia barretti TaxID=519541 RepID=A0AA35S9I1_GEOBA|nr:Gamma-aminobutyric acid type B receptor subunit 1 [Geodia barretti]